MRIPNGYESQNTQPPVNATTVEKKEPEIDFFVQVGMEIQRAVMTALGSTKPIVPAHDNPTKRAAFLPGWLGFISGCDDLSPAAQFKAAKKVANGDTEYMWKICKPFQEPKIARAFMFSLLNKLRTPELEINVPPLPFDRQAKPQLAPALQVLCDTCAAAWATLIVASIEDSRLKTEAPSLFNSRDRTVSKRVMWSGLQQALLQVPSSGKLVKPGVPDTPFHRVNDQLREIKLRHGSLQPTLFATAASFAIQKIEGLEVHRNMISQWWNWVLVLCGAKPNETRSGKTLIGVQKLLADSDQPCCINAVSKTKVVNLAGTIARA